MGASLVWGIGMLKKLLPATQGNKRIFVAERIDPCRKQYMIIVFSCLINIFLRYLSGLLVRVPGYRSRDPGSIPAQVDFLRSSGSGTGFTLPREYD
jgi:hypothetical protein